jgi:hypothetical protein
MVGGAASEFGKTGKPGSPNANVYVAVGAKGLSE